MVKFVLNNKLIQSDDPPGTTLLDCIRYREHLTGTKIGCREGDCGACTVLIGERKGPDIDYRSATSCLTAIGNVHNKHVVTVEGLNTEKLNVLQQAICDEGASQCGFCTPGFIVSMAGFSLSGKAPTHTAAVAAVDGNICRCTGYKSIERALARLTAVLVARPAGTSPVDFAIAANIIPGYFSEIPRRLAELSQSHNGVLHPSNAIHHNGTGSNTATPDPPFLGGGTDLYVRQPEQMAGATPEFLLANPQLQGIHKTDGWCTIGAATTVTQLLESPVIRRAFPHFDHYAKLISSTPIRNIATVAGNFVNASPIGDLSIFFLALDTELTLTDGTNRRTLPLQKFFKSYKTLAKTREEYIEDLRFPMPRPGTLFHFEKVSKRTCLDIASVNTAIRLTVKENTILEARLSAGGVGPVPAFLEKTSRELIGKSPNRDTVEKAIAVAHAEISPISDVRGTAEYKRILLGQLIKAHFITLFPHLPEADWL